MKPCEQCKGTGTSVGVPCPSCDGTGSGWKAALKRAYQLGVADGIAAMANAAPNGTYLQRDVDALVEELKEMAQ